MLIGTGKMQEKTSKMTANSNEEVTEIERTLSDKTLDTPCTLSNFTQPTFSIDHIYSSYNNNIQLR